MGRFVGFLSLGFIVGGLVVARKAGKSPLRTLFLVNVVMWTICIFFTIQASIVLLAIGLFTYTDSGCRSLRAKHHQTVPPERQGRVFGFAQSIEQAGIAHGFHDRSIAQFIFIPFDDGCWGGSPRYLVRNWNG